MVVEAACSDITGTADFYVAAHHHSSSLHVDWANSDGQAQRTAVAVTTLDAFFDRETGRDPPAFIKIDIEGGGTHALPGARRLFSENRPFCLIEFTHPRKIGPSRICFVILLTEVIASMIAIGFQVPKIPIQTPMASGER